MLPKCGFIICAVLFFICLEVNSDLTDIEVSKPREDQDSNWWKNGVFYQIYVPSFKEHFKDVTDPTVLKGIGNLKGIIDEFPTLKDMGITAICLSQIILDSDITFKKINEDYGDDVDFTALVKEAVKNEIKIILNIDINHSGKTEKFKEEQSKPPPHEGPNTENYYVWHPGNNKGEYNKNDPPNNWLSVYGDSAWEWSETRQEFYLHQFAIDQPDLNYNNPVVIKALQDGLKYWLDKGVDGFILNGVSYLFEEDNQWTNETVIPDVDSYKYESLIHNYTKDQEKTFNFVYDLRSFMDEYQKTRDDKITKILMSEGSTLSIENTMKYYEDGNGKQGVHVPFNFQLVDLDSVSGSNATKIVDLIKVWNKKMPKGQTANWLIGDHNHHRAATRFGTKLANNMNILIASLPGVMITYNGEEIGQKNGEVAYIQCKDPMGCKAGAADFPKVSRDFERTPYQWSQEDNAGFTDPEVEPWLPVGKDYKETNLEKQKNEPETSSYKIYKHFLELRENELYNKTEFKLEALSDSVIKITRGSESEKDKHYIILLNMGNQTETVKASDDERQLYEVINFTGQQPNQPKQVWARKIEIPAQAAMMFKIINKKADEYEYDWWKHAVIYQIYVRSFKDMNNDGIGDLKGIISKLDYLKELGVNAVCLSSIYDSPNNDLGYDVRDFEKIHRDYEFEDGLFQKLIAEAKDRGIKVIIDFVPNHSSTAHSWFVSNELYYIRATGKNLNPPNNWLSIFHGPAWTEMSPDSKDYYLHQFHSTQADLDYDTDVKNLIKGSLEYWLKRGVAGFRMTGVPYIFEDRNFPDEPPSNDPLAKRDEWKSLRHIYTSNLPATFNLINEWRDLLDRYTVNNGGTEKILITEAYTDIHNTMYYYGSNKDKGAHLVLNFQLIEKVNCSSTAIEFAQKINEWIHLIPEGFTSNWVLGNHDKHRVATRFGPENVDGFNMLAAILPGVMVAYNGEEIGQENGYVPLNNCKGDPVFCDFNATEQERDKFWKFRRDRQRTPFHWDNSFQAGFTTSKGESWLPISNKYTKNNLALQINDTNSHYELYKRLTKLRQKAAFKGGSIKVKYVTKWVLTTLRYHTPEESYFHLFNLGGNEETFNLKVLYNETTPFLEVVETNNPEKLPTGTLLNATSMSLQGHQSVIAAFSQKTPPSSATIHAISSFVLILGLLMHAINFN